MRRWLVACFMILSACNGTAEEDGADLGPPPTLRIETDRGPVVGALDEDLRVYLGIPYAAPPTGARRFRPPQPRDPWQSELVADHFGAACPQPDGSLLTLAPGTKPSMKAGTDEDCLSLNIWTHNDRKKRPVMLFIHGGGHLTGSSDNSFPGMSTPLYGGRNLALAGDVVVVTINYRLGALGFYATDALLAEGPAGNQGVRDVIAALSWVKTNIAAFGGDPSNVTVFGESAGAGNTCALLASSAADGLYHRAIIQSGRCVQMASLHESAPGRTGMIERGNAITAAAGCGTASDPVQCMRDLSANEVVQATIDGGGTLFGLPMPDISPGIDGDLITEQPIDRVENGGIDVPILVGSNADELNWMLQKDVSTSEDYENRVRDALGNELGDQVLALYPASNFESPKEAWGSVASDVIFVCPALAMAAAASAGPHPSFAYHFTHTAGGGLEIGGAFHGLELMYVFGNLHPWANADAADQEVVTAMQRAWSSFAKHGAPDSDPAWPAYDKTTKSVWLADSPPTVTSEIREGRCEKLEALGIVR